MYVVEYLLRWNRKGANFSVTVGLCYVKLLCRFAFNVIIYIQLILRTIMGSTSCESNPKKGMEVAVCHTVCNKYGSCRNYNIRQSIFQNLLKKKISSALKFVVKPDV